MHNHTVASVQDVSLDSNQTELVSELNVTQDVKNRKEMNKIYGYFTLRVIHNSGILND